jgi:hypothetical protein
VALRPHCFNAPALIYVAQILLWLGRLQSFSALRTCRLSTKTALDDDGRLPLISVGEHPVAGRRTQGRSCTLPLDGTKDSAI